LKSNKEKFIQNPANTIIIFRNYENHPHHHLFAAADIFNLIGQIPEAQYNSIDKTLKINGSEAITYTLDGIDASENELAALTPDMVKSISIIHTPKGKYISNGIRYVVEIKKKKETGILLNLQNFLILGPSNEKAFITNEQPRLNLQYSAEKFDLNAGYGFGNIKWNYQNVFTRKYPDGTTVTNECHTETGPTEFIDDISRLNIKYNVIKK